MNRGKAAAAAGPSRQDQERFIQAILEGASELGQTRRDPASITPSGDDRESSARLRELRSRSNALALAFGYRE
jgi:hypothetical protein